MSDKTMKVVAVAKGFYGDKIRQIGDEFDVAAGSKATWFEPVSLGEKPKRGRKKKTEE